MTLFSLTFVAVLTGSGLVSAQPPETLAAPTDRWSDFRLSDAAVASSQSARRAAADAAALGRRERAAFHAQQRALRSEANAWLGISPLRPSWPSTPITHSYYQPRRIIYYPGRCFLCSL